VPGPSAKIQRTTLKSFGEIAESNKPWSPYFARAKGALSRKRLIFENRTIDHCDNALAAAVECIDERKTVFLTFRDPEGKYPGDHPEYVAYLQEILTEAKYAAATASVPGKTCSLCSASPTTVYPNALRGAKLNIANMDREGAFPGISKEEAWKSFALCPACADLLYIYKNHISGDFVLNVAGERALVLPYTQIDLDRRKTFLRRVKQIPERTARDALLNQEEALLRLLGDETVVTSMTFLWADFGNAIENVRGVVSDVLPSRLSQIERWNSQTRETASPLFPQRELEEFSYDLRLSALRPMLRRPGGRKAKSVNESKRLFELKRELVAAIYHGRGLRSDRRLWQELLLTAKYFLNDAAENRDSYTLLYEGFSEKKNTPFLTFAGWTRQLAKFLHYLRLTGVFPPMDQQPYIPDSEALKPYFAEESGIDDPKKAFAFILGALSGKVMQVQAARGVNVGANALTWLKRLTLKGADLPELYVKVREKLLSYETERNPRVREIVEELGRLGQRIGDQFDLGTVPTCYFLLLGQSLATTIMPGKPRETKGEES